MMPGIKNGRQVTFLWGDNYQVWMTFGGFST